MKKYSIYGNNIKSVLFAFILISIFKLNKQEEKYESINLKFTSAFSLLNNKYVVVGDKGIYFYNREFSNIYNYINFTVPSLDVGYDTVSMAQFPADDGGYILIMVKNIFYIFDNEGAYLKDYDFNNITNKKHHCLIPYGKENDILNYFIIYIESGKICIKYFKFNLTDYSNENIIFYANYYDNGNQMNLKDDSLNCIFMKPLDSLNIGHELITCFYISNDSPYIRTVSFDPKNNFSEISSTIFNTSSTLINYAPTFINGVTNKDKEKAIVYIIFATSLFSSTFDFTNGFSILNLENIDKYMMQDTFFTTKMIYFEDTNEFVIASAISGGCKLLIMKYNNDYQMIEKGILDYTSPCYFTRIFSIVYNGTDYLSLIFGEGDKSLFQSIKNMKKITIETSIIETTIPTTETSIIETTIPPTETSKIDTTIPTIETSIIETTIPTTEASIIETTKPTTEASIIETTIPTTESSIIETTIPTTEASIIETTIPTTESSIIETSNVMLESTEIKKTENSEVYIIEKCKDLDSQSYSYNLCISCNEAQGYYQAIFPNNSFLHGYIECYNNDTKPVNFYFDNSVNKYKACYETCETCSIGGNGNVHNCLTCDFNHRKRIDKNGIINCITNCSYFYYYNKFGQYRCTNNSYCPEEANLFIKDLKKCTNKCNKEEKYQFQYGGQCLEGCPQDTSPNSQKICLIDNVDSCLKSESEIDIQEFLKNGGIDIKAKNYAKEFNYTKKQVSYYHNNIYSIFFYKDSSCINELSLNVPKVDFGDCYTKIKNKLEPPTTDNIIIALIEKLNGKKSTTSYLFYHPETGAKIDADSICKDEEVIVKESVLSELNNSDVDLNSALFLAKQNINIFNISDEFYTDICYHFESPNGKDVPLGDRIKTYFPNITLCDSQCTCKGVNLTTMESICECKFSSLMNNQLIEENILISNAIEEIFDLLRSSNLLVLKCYKDVFKKEYIIKGYGGFIILSITILEIIFSLIFIFKDMAIIRRFLYNLTEYFLIFERTYELNSMNIIRGYNKISNPKKRKVKNENKLKEINDNKNKRKINYIPDNLYDESSKYSYNLKSELKTINTKASTLKSQAKFINDNKKNSNNIKALLKLKRLCGNINLEDYLKPDLDDLEFDDAIKYDQRSWDEFLSERLKEKQIIMNTFYYKENLRPMSIKIVLFLINIDLYFIINGLFYSEEYLSLLFNSNEEDSFFSYFPRSISRYFYAVIVSYIIGIIIDCIFIEERKVKHIFLREKDDYIQLRYEISVIIQSIKTRYNVFISLCLFISVISWYYVSCFNNVYPGVKIEWIKSSITIILIMQIFSIILVLLEGLLRFLSFKCKSEKLYKIKQIIS